MSEHLKRFKAPDSWHISKKTNTFITKTAPGPHNANALPVAVWLRDQMGFARNMKEIKQILHQRDVIVNGRACRDPKMELVSSILSRCQRSANITGYSATRTAGIRPSRSMSNLRRPVSARSATRRWLQTEKYSSTCVTVRIFLVTIPTSQRTHWSSQLTRRAVLKLLTTFPMPLATWQW